MIIKQVAVGLLAIGLVGSILYGVPFLPFILTYMIDNEEEYAIFFYILIAILVIGIIGAAILVIVWYTNYE